MLHALRMGNPHRLEAAIRGLSFGFFTEIGAVEYRAPVTYLPTEFLKEK